MKLRWSNGHSYAVEFEANTAEGMAQAMENAMIDYRRARGPHGRIELHVETASNHWCDPVLPWGETVEIVGHVCDSGYGHVIQLPGREPDAEFRPVIRGTDPVLIVGPGHWHGPQLFASCMASVRHMNALTGFCADVSQAVLDAHKTNCEERSK